MKAEAQVPRNALVWIIVSQFVLVVPHLGRVPPWIILIFLLSAFWRSMVYQGRWSFPGKAIKVALTLSCLLGVGYSYRTVIGLEPTVALLLTVFALKLIELAERKDAYVVLFLAYFVCVTEFLFSQEILTTLYMLVAVMLVTTALVALHQPGEDSFKRGTFRRAGVMLLQSFPLMLVLFFVFPRIGPLWSVPMQTQTARSGVSDFMSPGDISSLSLSDEVAFRVQFEGDVPARRELYWRGLVFSSIEENTWRSIPWRDVPAMERRQRKPRIEGESVDYSIIMEPTQQNWLYSIRYAHSLDAGVLSSNDFRLASPNEVQDKRRYRVRSYLDTPIERDLSDWRREVETQLTRFRNPQSRQLAQRMFEQAGADPQRYVTALLTMFRTDEFFYTLNPPLLGGNAVDDFLFQSRRGFCEHYAAAFAFMARAAGVPARVVAGYQGGEINPVNGTVVVHQFDAHAWNEVWYEGEGWVRVDPTAAIAPDRIEFGLEAALLEEGSFLSDSPLSPLRYRNIAWLNKIRLQLDAINYSWQLFVLNYDSDSQTQLFSRVFGKISMTQMGLALMGFWMLFLLPVAIALMRGQRSARLDPATLLYQDFCRKLARIDLKRGRSEAPTDFAGRVSAVRPDLAAEVGSITRLYDAISYRSRTSEEALALLRKQVRGFRPARV